MKIPVFVRFLLVGAASAVTQFGVLAFLYEVFAFPLGFSVSIAYVASVIVHFSGNKHITFGSTVESSAGEMFRYTSVVLINYLITISVFGVVVGVLKCTPYTATLTSIAVTVGIGFVLSKRWVFKSN